MSCETWLSLLDCILPLTRVDQFSAYFSSPLGHADSEINIPECNDRNNERIISVILDKKMADGDSEIDKLGTT
jgi:hypothetical protein